MRSSRKSDEVHAGEKMLNGLQSFRNFLDKIAQQFFISVHISPHLANSPLDIEDMFGLQLWCKDCRLFYRRGNPSLEAVFQQSLDMFHLKWFGHIIVNACLE